MQTNQLPFSDIDSMVFSLEHQMGKLEKNTQLPERCLYIIPESQHQLRKTITQWINPKSIVVLDESMARSIASRFKGGAWKRIVFISVSDWHEPINDQAILSFFRLIKMLLPQPKVKLDIVTVNSIESSISVVATHPIDSIYVGFAQTLAKEQTDWEVNCLSLNKLTKTTLASALNQELNIPIGLPLSVRDDAYSYPAMMPTELAAWNGQSSFRKEGVYLIIGANGGIGSMMSRYLAKNYRAKLILVGRRSGNDELCAELEALGASQVNYESLDLTNKEQVDIVLGKYPQINGIIHSALLLQDASIQGMTEDNLINVLQPKVHGTINLIQAIRYRVMDFVLFFSSIQSYIANAGQANYTAACVCKDALANLLHHAFMIDAKVVNWGFWGNIGIVAKEKYRKRMEQLEIGSIEGNEGMAIIERLLNSDKRQITVVKASERALKRLRIQSHQKVSPQQKIEKSITMKINDSRVLEMITPQYNSNDTKVHYNEAIAEALKQYSRAELHKLNLPQNFDPKFSKLMAAIQAIPNGVSEGRAALLRRFPEIVGHLDLIDTCLAAYPDILQGKIDPLAVMFPEGSFKLVEPVYRDNPIADYFNSTVAETVLKFQENNGDRPLRIIEIGAGTGSTTQFVLPKLNKGNVSYTFTDLSFAFLNKARKRFDAYPFVEYKIYNIEQAPKFDEKFDIVIATNVIHATSNLDQTISNVNNLLNDGGVFILNEITSCQDYATLTFGLTEGWWLAIDEYRIPNSPLLTSDTWVKLMMNCGFSATKTHGNADQQLIIGYNGTVAPNEQQPAQRPEEKQIEPTVVKLSQEQVEGYIKSVIAEVMFMEVNEIQSDLPFSDYGIDSIISMELINPFKAVVGYLPATLLFEYPSVSQLAAYFLSSFEQALSEKLIGTAAEVSVEVVDSTADSRSPIKSEPRVVEQATSIDRVGNETTNQQVSSQDFMRKFSRKSIVAQVNSKKESVESSKAFVREVIMEVMRVEANELRDDDPFKEMGIDSIIALELINPLKAKYGYLPTTLLFEYPTINQLSVFLDEQLVSKGAPENIKEEIAPEPAAVIETPIANQIEAGNNTEHNNGDFKPEDIAIVGMSAKLPKANDINQFWDNLVNGRDCTSDIPKERWATDRYEKNNNLSARGSYTTKGAFINDIEAFDNKFFNLTPLDAERIDPQERLFLQNVYQTILDAGYPKTSLENSETGVFVGVMNNAYAWHTPIDEAAAAPTSLFWSIANRVSYFYNWNGPSMAVDTACSSSLTALHTAIRAIQSGDCKQAIVGGVNLIVHPRQYELLCNMHMLSRSGQCKPFGEGADGFVDGEGICSIMVKSYADAIADNDRIYAVVRGSSINSGGRANGYSAPNAEAQANLIRQTISRANVDPSEVAYVEAHGTGTELGDPIELRALSRAYEGVQNGSVSIGSVKSNVGHLESAAGLSGLIKSVLQMQNNRLVPSLNSTVENPHLNIANTPFRISKTTEAWPEGKKRISALSSFGAGGSNAHVLLQYYTAAARRKDVPHGTAFIIPLSSNTQQGLQAQIDRLRNYLNTPQAAAIGIDVLAYMLACARDHMAYRIAFVAYNLSDLKTNLETDIAAIKSQANATNDQSFNEIDETVLQRFAAAKSVASAYQNGAKINWSAIYPNRSVGSIPGYTFEQTRFWINSKESEFFKPQHLVEEHQILGHKIAPAAWSLSALFQKENISGVKNVVWREMLYNINDAVVNVEEGKFRIVNKQTNALICSGEVTYKTKIEGANINLENFEQAKWVEGAEIYENFAEQGYVYGKPLRGIQWAKVSETLVKGCIAVSHDWGYDLSPALIDSGLQLAILIPAFKNSFEEGEILAPYQMSEMQMDRMPRQELIYCYCQYNSGGGRESQHASVDLYFTDANNQVIMMIKDLGSIRVNKSILEEQPSTTAESVSDNTDDFVAYGLR